MNYRSDNEPHAMTARGVHETVLRLIKENLKIPGKILDIGAGEGAFARLLTKEGHEVIGLDCDDSKWKTPEIELRFCDFDKECIDGAFSPDEKFDALVAIEVIEHIENPFEFVRQCRKLLRPDGLIFLTTPNVEAVNSRLIYLYTGRLQAFGEYETVRTGHLTPVFSWKIEMILREAGFEIAWLGYNQNSQFAGAGVKGKIGSLLVKFLQKIVKGKKGGENLIVMGRLNFLQSKLK